MLARCARCQGTFTTEQFGDLKCPHCGSDIRLNPPGETAPPQVAPDLSQGARPPTGEVSAPFVSRKAIGWVRSYIDTWKLAALDPAPFFRSVRISESGSAVLFAVISITIGGWASGLFSLASSGARNAMMHRLLESSQDPTTNRIFEWIESTSRSWSIAGLIIMPFIALAILYLTAGIIHVLLVLLGGAKRGFDATLTTVGYCFGVYLIQALPMCGGVVAPIWFIVCAIVGLNESQRCGTAKAAGATLAPIVLLCCCLCLGGMGIAMAGRGLMGIGSGEAPQ